MTLNWTLLMLGCSEPKPQSNSEDTTVIDTGCTAEHWYLDSDGDGYGEDSEPVESCVQPDGHVDNSDDCDDGDADEFPDQVWHVDSDGDGFGDANHAVINCQRPLGHVLDSTDCDDSDPTRNTSTVWYLDSDGDGYGNLNQPVDSCTADGTASPNSLDCDDSNAFIRPDINEVCDGIDNNCDSLIDDADPNVDAFTQSPVFLDSDNDGYGNEYIGLACSLLANESFQSEDCDDSDPNVHPNNLELTDDADQNCDGETLVHFGVDIQQQLTIETLTSSSKEIMVADMTGDGLAELIVYGTQSNTTPGTLTISNLSGDGQSISENPALQWTDPIEDGDFGAQITNVQDLDSDGSMDWLVSAPGANTERVYLLNSDSPPMSEAQWFWETPQPGNAFGTSMITLGDIDGDGTMEAAVGAPYHNESGTRRGAVYLLDETVLDGQTIPETVRFGPSAYSNFGIDIDNAGDIDGDGLDDILILSPTGFGTVYVFQAQQIFDSSVDIDSLTTFVGANHAQMNNAQVHAVGDYNGDGYKDFAVASGETGLLLSLGSGNLTPENPLLDAALQLEHSGGNNLFARSVLRDIDIDQDGNDELIFANPGEDTTGTYTSNNHGAVLGFWGGERIGVFDDAAGADFIIRGNSGFLGYGLASSDLDQDGWPDILIAKADQSILLLFGDHMQ